MHVTHQFAALAADHHAHLGVRLVAHDAVHHLRPHFLQVRGQLDVRRLVEPRPQFDDHQHLLAGRGGIHQCLHHRGIRAGAIQRLPDGEHVRVAGGLAQEVHHWGERIEWVMQQHIAFADGGEHVHGALDAARDARCEAGVFEVWPIHQIGNLHQPHHVHRPVAAHHIRIVQVELALQEVRHRVGALVRQLQAHGIAKAPRRQLALHGAQEVVHLFLVHKQVAVAGDAELIAAGRAHARKQLIDVGVDDGGQEHELVARPVVSLRQPHDAGQGAGRLHDGHAAAAAKGVLAVQRDDETQALVQHAGEWMRRVQPDGRQYRLQLVVEEAFQPLALALVPFVAAQETDAFGGEARHQDVVQHPVLLGDQLPGAFRDAPQLLRRREVIRPAMGDAERLLLFEAGDADFEELV